jgi:RNA polymerase sigma-70 factor (ECF subfamily)
MKYMQPAIIRTRRSSGRKAPRARTRKDQELPRKKLSDEELFVRYEKGDQAAFEELFARYRRPIFYFILRFLRDEHASQDAVQDLFLRVIQDPSRFQARSRFSTWLHAVARNLCIDMLRKRKHRLAVSLDQPGYRSDSSSRSSQSGPPLVERLQGDTSSPELATRRGFLRVKLLVAIRSLPDEQRVVFLLREVGGLAFAEIAKILGVPLNTAKSRMRYALNNLRRIIETLDIDNPDNPDNPDRH